MPRLGARTDPSSRLFSVYPDMVSASSSQLDLFEPFSRLCVQTVFGLRDRTWRPKRLPGLVSDEALRLDLESEPFRGLARPESRAPGGVFARSVSASLFNLSSRLLVIRSRGSWKLGFRALYYSSICRSLPGRWYIHVERLRQPWSGYLPLGQRRLKATPAKGFLQFTMLAL